MSASRFMELMHDALYCYEGRDELSNVDVQLIEQITTQLPSYPNTESLLENMAEEHKSFLSSVCLYYAHRTEIDSDLHLQLTVFLCALNINKHKNNIMTYNTNLTANISPTMTSLFPHELHHRVCVTCGEETNNDLHCICWKHLFEKKISEEDIISHALSGCYYHEYYYGNGRCRFNQQTQNDMFCLVFNVLNNIHLLSLGTKCDYYEGGRKRELGCWWEDDIIFEDDIPSPRTQNNKKKTQQKTDEEMISGEEEEEGDGGGEQQILINIPHPPLPLNLVSVNSFADEIW
jgi:hypothetical protein